MNGIVKCRAANVSTANVKVTLFNAGSGKSVKVVETTADSTGAFSFPEIAPDVTAPEPFFIVSTMPTNELIMTAILGSTFPATYYINEVTTVAAAYSAAQFITAGLVIEASPFALSIVAAMCSHDSAIARIRST